MPAPGKMVVNLPEAVHAQIKEFARTKNMKIEEFCVSILVQAITKGSESGSISNEIEYLPLPVINLLRRYWRDAQFRGCLQGLGKVWETGEQKVKDALSANCEVFKEYSEKIEQGRVHGTTGEEELQRRMVTLLEDADALKERPPGRKKKGRDPRGG